jgi:hypothetical protein
MPGTVREGRRAIGRDAQWFDVRPRCAMPTGRRPGREASPHPSQMLLADLVDLVQGRYRVDERRLSVQHVSPHGREVTISFLTRSSAATACASATA